MQAYYYPMNSVHLEGTRNIFCNAFVTSVSAFLVRLRVRKIEGGGRYSALSSISGDPLCPFLSLSRGGRRRRSYIPHTIGMVCKGQRLNIV